MTVPRVDKIGVPPSTPPAVVRLLPDLEDDVARVRFQRLVVALVAAGLVALLAVGGQRPPDPNLVAESARSTVEPFGERAFRVRPAAGQPEAADLAGAIRCAMLADSPELRAEGMQRKSTFSGYDAMLFVFGEDATGSFHMRNVPIDLAIAWFDAAGDFVSSARMKACPGGGADCATYSAAGPHRYALEVAVGGLRRLGVGPGSRLIPQGSCVAAGRPLPADVPTGGG